MSDVQKGLIALFSLAILAVIVSNGQAIQLINAASQFLVSMVNKVNGSGQTS